MTQDEWEKVKNTYLATLTSASQRDNTKAIFAHLDDFLSENNLTFKDLSQPDNFKAYLQNKLSKSTLKTYWSHFTQFYSWLETKLEKPEEPIDFKDKAIQIVEPLFLDMPQEEKVLYALKQYMNLITKYPNILTQPANPNSYGYPQCKHLHAKHYFGQFIGFECQNPYPKIKISTVKIPKENPIVDMRLVEPDECNRCLSQPPMPNPQDFGFPSEEECFLQKWYSPIEGFICIGTTPSIRLSQNKAISPDDCYKCIALTKEKALHTLVKALPLEDKKRISKEVENALIVFEKIKDPQLKEKADQIIMQRALEEVKAERQNLNKVIRSKEIEIKNKDDKIWRLEETLRQLNEKMQRLTQESKSKDMAIQSLREDLKFKDETSQKLQNEYAPLKIRHDQLYNENKALKEECSTLNITLSKLHNEHQRLQNDYEAIKDKLPQDILSENKDLKGELTRLQTELDTLTRRNINLNERNEVLDDKINDLTSTLQNKEQIIDSLIEQNQMLELGFTPFRDCIKDLLNILSKQQQDMFSSTVTEAKRLIGKS